MKIVVLDAYTVNPGDLSWAPLQQLGPCEIHRRTEPDQVVGRAAGAEVLLTNKTRLGPREFAALPALKYVGVLATGYDVVDVRAAAQANVVVCNVPAYSTDSVAQLTVALLLELSLHLAVHGEATRTGRWSASREFSHAERPLTELAGKTFGIVGLGRIGHAVANVVAALGMRVVASASHGRAADANEPRIERLPLAELFERVDVLSLHCPLTEQTARLVNAERLATMKRGAWLINTARGGLVDETALAAALHSGQLGAAALDVLAVEPPPADHPLLSAPNCLVTPHIAWATRAARERLLRGAVANIEAFLQGRPQNVVSPRP